MKKIKFPKYKGIRCLMMPFIQGRPESIPKEYRSGYEKILNENFLEEGEVGFLTIDESPVESGKAHRANRAKQKRALHTEVGRHPDSVYCWGGGSWGSSNRVILEEDTKILIANNVDNSCALWDTEHRNTSIDGDIGDKAHLYPYENAVFMKSGEVHEIGIFTPHESVPVKESIKRQFLRIVGNGVHGREPYFTRNPLLGI